MNDQVKIIGNGREHIFDLPDGIDLAGMQARIVGRTIVLEPIGKPAPRVPPGTYARQTLPPLSEGARKILASIDAVAPLRDAGSPLKSAADRGEEDDLIELEDDGAGIDLSDEGLPGIDPGR